MKTKLAAALVLLLSHSAMAQELSFDGALFSSAPKLYLDCADCNQGDPPIGSPPVLGGTDLCKIYPSACIPPEKIDPLKAGRSMLLGWTLQSLPNNGDTSSGHPDIISDKTERCGTDFAFSACYDSALQSPKEKELVKYYLSQKDYLSDKRKLNEVPHNSGDTIFGHPSALSEVWLCDAACIEKVRRSDFKPLIHK